MQVSEQSFPVFMDVLEAIAKRNGWQEELAADWPARWSSKRDARTLEIHSGGKAFVVVLLKRVSPAIPGQDVQRLLLLDRHGRLLDSLKCGVSNRVTGEDAENLQTVLPNMPQPDGAQLVIRLGRKSARGNFAHKITHGGENASFYWGHYDLPGNQPTKWDKKGLCRLTIHDCRFEVLFPRPEDQEPREP
jgi:hypothetical protein